MAARRRTSSVIGLVGLAAAAGLFVFTGCGGKTLETADTPTPSAKSASIAERLRRSDVEALRAVVQKLDPPTDVAAKGLTEAEATDWLDTLNAVRAGYLRFATVEARAAAVDVAQRIVQKFSVEPAPVSWIQALTPFRDILCTGLADREVVVRATTLAALGRVWAWYPGRTMIEVEETQLAEWKNAFQAQVVRQLADRDPRGRAAAVACLALVPVDNLAAPALAYLDDPTSALVRHQVLISFGGRPALLTEEMIIKRLHDSDPGLPQLAEVILKARGLSGDQIALGRLITSPKPEIRASVIPLLKEHEDFDPGVWLLRLSYDSDELVRAKAVEAMVGNTSPEIRERLRELSTHDASPAVRAAASKLVALLPNAGATVALPPLPGSPKLTPQAN